MLRCQSSSVKPSLEKQHLDCIPGLLSAQQCLPASQPPLVKDLGFGVGVGLVYSSKEGLGRVYSLSQGSFPFSMPPQPRGTWAVSV